MSAQEYNCPKCGAKNDAEGIEVGKPFNCTRCGSLLHIPAVAPIFGVGFADLAADPDKVNGLLKNLNPEQVRSLLTTCQTNMGHAEATIQVYGGWLLAPLVWRNTMLLTLQSIANYTEALRQFEEQEAIASPPTRPAPVSPAATRSTADPAPIPEPVSAFTVDSAWAQGLRESVKIVQKKRGNQKFQEYHRNKLEQYTSKLAELLSKHPSHPKLVELRELLDSVGAW